MLSEEDLRKSADRVLMTLGLVLGMAAGWMIGKGVFETDWLPQLFKFYPLTILFYLSIY
ncbi:MULTISPECIES: hypothetical protein [unclassified Archaeoglobus]|uniref:hypothetical protein n=1 Tax=unclassified Archaeoglobus TaxID=2643606 RepID=UPI0025BA73A8|nr:MULTISPECIES: hypothetical protein [unclassified Archaeoglobus]